MWKSLFTAIGLYGVILGVECLAVEKVVLRTRTPQAIEAPDDPSLQAGRREIAPPDWAPFSLMGLGSVVILYSFTLPRRARGK